jgi:hypothetical protein
VNTTIKKNALILRRDFRKATAQHVQVRRTTRAMLIAAEEVGDLSGIKREDLSKEGAEHGKNGLVGYLKWAAKCEPRSFLNILGKLLPVQMKVDSFTQTVYQSVEELERDISQRGINMRSFGNSFWKQVKPSRASSLSTNQCRVSQRRNQRVKPKPILQLSFRKPEPARRPAGWVRSDVQLTRHIVFWT